MKIELMEPSEFDQIIKNKLAEENNAHAKEIEKAKPFVWAAIQENRNRKPMVFFYYLAAAILLILLCSSYFMNISFQQHSKEVATLSQKIELMQASYNLQLNLLQTKNKELDDLCIEVEQLEESLIDSEPKVDSKVLKQLVYVYDTVFIKQTEYITQVVPAQGLQESEEIEVDKIEEPEISTSLLEEKETNIYPSYASSRVKNTQEENVKFKFSSFVSN